MCLRHLDHAGSTESQPWTNSVGARWTYTASDELIRPGRPQANLRWPCDVGRLVRLFLGEMGKSIARGEGFAPLGVLIQRGAPLYPLMIGGIYNLFGEQSTLVRMPKSEQHLVQQDRRGSRYRVATR
jgi:hypothetical protein